MSGTGKNQGKILKEKTQFFPKFGEKIPIISPNFPMFFSSVVLVFILTDICSSKFSAEGSISKLLNKCNPSL